MLAGRKNLVTVSILVVFCGAQSLSSLVTVQRIAFGSCNDPAHQGVWRQIQLAEPDKLILLGDTIYADRVMYADRSKFFEVVTPSHISDQYTLLKEDIEWKSLLKQLNGFENIMATFDDHDYGTNNGHKNFPHRNTSQSLFWDFINVPKESSVRLQSGVYSSKTIRIGTGPNEFIYKVWLR